MQVTVISELERMLGADAVLSRPADLLMYEYDGSAEMAKPDVVVFPRTTAQVVELVKLAHRTQTPLVGRGAGTGLSGGALARQGGILVVFARMNRVLELDVANQRAVVQPGVVNLDLTREVEHAGLFFAPDPSSQKSCTIGGNVAENAGGPHTLLYGVTTNHVLGLELVLMNGEVVRIGGKAVDLPGYDLNGLLVGSEGTLAFVTEITVRLLRKAEAVKTLLAIYETADDATETVVAITGKGITPAACEMLDGWTLRAVEAFAHAGFPLDSAAVLLIEVEGCAEAVAAQARDIAEVCMACRAREVRVARDEHERDLLWKGRKNAFGAVGRLSPSYYVQDGVIPRTRLPETLRFIDAVARKRGLQAGNIFHAGDGNLHPLLPFDWRKKDEFERVVQAANEIMAFCISVGGSITGEHGVGMEKNELMSLQFSPADLALMRRMRDAFNPAGLLNPAKLFPGNKGCGEIRVLPVAGTPVASAAGAPGSS
jgi:glycolate oxidase